MSAVGMGIVGTGQRCMFFFGPYIKAHPEKARVIAVCDHHRARLRSAVQDLGRDIRGYDGFDAMLGDPQIEAVIIATPDFTHRDMLEKTLAARKHVLCEKPLATTIEDALAMTKMAMSSTQVVQLGFMLRYAPFFVKLKEVVDSGIIGPLVQVSAAEVVEYYHGAAFFRRWHRFQRNSGGLLIHKACHTVDVINWLVAAVPMCVSATGGTNTFVPKERAAGRCRECGLAATCPAVYRAEEYNWTYQTREERENLQAHANDLCPYSSEKDSVDNAVVTVQYDNGVRLSFSFATTGPVTSGISSS